MPRARNTRFTFQPQTAWSRDLRRLDAHFSQAEDRRLRYNDRSRRLCGASGDLRLGLQLFHSRFAHLVACNRRGRPDGQRTPGRLVLPRWGVGGVTTGMSPNQAPLGPALPRERIQVLDALRGFALFGILVINLYSFAGWFYLSPEERAFMTGPLDRMILRLDEVLVYGKFYTILSLLFGIGFSLQLQRGADSDPALLGVYRRRLGILLGIGLLHIALLWQGDILTLYALCGFLLIPFRRCSDRTLLRWAVVFILVPVGISAAMILSGGRFDPGYPFFRVEDSLWARFFPPDTETLTVLGGRSWHEILKFNLAGVFDRFGDLFRDGRLFKVEAIFLVGLWAGRRLKDGRLLAQGATLRAVFIFGLAIGLPASFVLNRVSEANTAARFSAVGLLEAVLYVLAMAPLGLGYAAGFALLCRRMAWGRVLNFMAPAGRMALSNYLSQTLIGLSFYGVGFGIVGGVGPASMAVLAVLIFAGQVVVSSVWLRYFQFGPVEWAWRSLTYQRFLPLRLASAGERRGDALRGAAPAGPVTP